MTAWAENDLDTMSERQIAVHIVMHLGLSLVEFMLCRGRIESESCHRLPANLLRFILWPSKVGALKDLGWSNLDE